MVATTAKSPTGSTNATRRLESWGSFLANDFERLQSPPLFGPNAGPRVESSIWFRANDPPRLESSGFVWAERRFETRLFRVRLGRTPLRDSSLPRCFEPNDSPRVESSICFGANALARVESSDSFGLNDLEDSTPAAKSKHAQRVTAISATLYGNGKIGLGPSDFAQLGCAGFGWVLLG